MRRELTMAALLALVATAAAGQEAVRPDLKAALRATASFSGLDRAAATAIAPRQPFAIVVAVQNLAGPEPPKGLQIFGWLRRVAPDDLPCQQAAEAFLRSGGALPAGAIFLNDPVIGMVTEDDAFTLSDPEFSLASANLLAASRFPTAPADLVADEPGRRFLLPFPEEGVVRSVSATGVTGTPVAGLDRPVAAAAGPDGSLWVLESGGTLVHVGTDGGRDSRDLGASVLRPGANPAFLATAGPGGTVVLDAAGGSERLRLPDPATDAALLGPEGVAPTAVATLHGTVLAIRYLDAPDQAVTVMLPQAATRLAAAPDGRLLVAWSPEGGPAAFVDAARGRLLQTSGAPVAISEVAFTARTAALMMADQSRVATIDTGALLRDGAADLRETPIGLPRDPPLTHGGLLAALRPTDGLLAVHAGSHQAYRIEEASALGNAPPMTAASLGGGVPARVATLDRSFREERPGLFRTAASLPGPGRYELVATTGLGSLSFCAMLPVAMPVDPAAPPPPSRLVVAPEPGGGLRIAAMDTGGRPLAGISGTLTFAALSGAWRARAHLATGDDGRSLALYRPPRVGGIVVTLTPDAPGGARFDPLILEDLP